MKIHRYLIILFPVFSALWGFSQSGLVKPEDAQLAIRLREKYKTKNKEAGVVAIHDKKEFSFSLSSSRSLKSPVLATESSLVNFISIKDNYNYQDALFYDVESEIRNLNAKAPRGMPVVVSAQYNTYQEQGIFYSDAKVCTFSVPFETRGKKLDVSYEKRYYDVRYLTSVFFHEEYPIEEKIISFSVPDWLQVELKEMNFDGYDIEKSVTEDPKKKIKTYSYTAKSLPALKAEENAPRVSRSYPHVLVLCKGYIANDGNPTRILESVKDLYGWYASLVKDIPNDPTPLKPVVDRLLADKKTDFDKIQAIYYWVQDNIRYIAFENGIMGFRPESAQNVFKNKYGDCKGMANLTKTMLKIAGFDARLTWIGTRDIPYDYSIPSLCVDNHMICTVILNGKKYFLDATVDYLALNDYEYDIQGRQVLIENGEEYILDQIPEFNSEHNKTESRITLSLTGNVLSGACKETINGEEKIVVLNGIASLRSDDRQDALKRYIAGGNSNLKIQQVTTSDLEERQNPLDIRYDFQLFNQVTAISAKEIYVLIDKDKEFADLEIDTAERVNDYETSHKISLYSVTELTLPDGFTLEYMPETVDKKFADFSFFLKYELQQNKIIYTKKITIDHGIIRKKDFPAWNNCIKAARNFYKDPIQLSGNR